MKHVADAIVYVANLPTNVQVLQMNIMCVPLTLLPYEHHFSLSLKQFKTRLTYSSLIY